MIRRLLMLVLISVPGLQLRYAWGQMSTPLLTIKEAEAIALKNHPLIQASQLTALAARQVTTEVKSAYYPLAYASLTAAGALSDSRIAAGVLNNPIIYNRYANGVTVSQLVTDFGRTRELAASSRLHAEAQQQDTETTRADVLLRVDQAYYAALRAQSVLSVAEQTVKQRRLVADQVSELAKSKLKSGLDVSFANVNLSEAKLMVVGAQNDVASAFADLSAALGYQDTLTYSLVDDRKSNPPPGSLPDLVQQALQNRPELGSLRLESQSAHRFAKAERDLWLPTVSFLGSAGLIPFYQSPLSNRYAAAGLNVSVPIFNGRLYSARAAEGRLRAQAVVQRERDEADRVARDVRLAWSNAQTCFERLGLAQQLLNNAELALDLAQERYKLGLGSIVELSQAQLNQTRARIEQVSATYEYQAQIANLNYQIGSLH